MKKTLYKTVSRNKGYSLAELVAALTIGFMVLAAVLTLYSRAEKTISSINHKLDNPNKAKEILQLISEDIDNIYAENDNVSLIVENRISPGGYMLYKLTITKSLETDDEDSQPLEQIIWQTSYDYPTNSLILYRAHTGLLSEDKMLDDDRASYEADFPYIPICQGVTNFAITIPRMTNIRPEDDPFDEELMLPRWTGNQLPPGLVVSISFSDELFTAPNGTWDVPFESKTRHVMAVDAVKNIPFRFKEIEESNDTESLINRY